MQTDLSSFNSQSYWLFYRPERYWSRTPPCAPISPISAELAQWLNYKVTIKAPAQRMYMIDQYIPSYGTGQSDPTIKERFKNFHKDGLNALYLDGHVKFVRGDSLVDSAKRRGFNASTKPYDAIINFGVNDNY